MDDKTPPEVIDITAMAGKFKNRSELQQYAEKLFLGLKLAMEKISSLQEENNHLKNLLDSTVPKFIIPDEQAIAEIQLERLKVVAMDRDLTLDETKRFDLLTKNLYLAKGKPTGKKPKDLELDDIPEAELIQLVKKDER